MGEEDENAGQETQVNSEINSEFEFSKGFVCLLDALGSKGNWNNNYKNAIDKHKLVRSNVVDLIRKISGSYYLEIKITFFSDTVLITSVCNKANENDYYDDFTKFISLVSIFFSYVLFNGLFFYRGSISCGEFYQDDDIVIGPAIDDVAMYYEMTDWIGIMLTSKASFKALKQINKRNSTPGNRYFTNIFLDYKDQHNRNMIPFKKVAFSDRILTINWPLYYKYLFEISHKNPEFKLNCESAREYLIGTFSRKMIPPEAIKKYENTLDFYDFCSTQNETAGFKVPWEMAKERL